MDMLFLAEQVKEVLFSVGMIQMPHLFHWQLCLRKEIARNSDLDRVPTCLLLSYQGSGQRISLAIDRNLKIDRLRSQELTVQ
jgi:hypothetical protein